MFKRLAGLACSLLRHYATAIPLMVEEHLPQGLSPDTASRIKAEVSRHALAMVERDIAVRAEQTIGSS